MKQILAIIKLMTGAPACGCSDGQLEAGTKTDRAADKRSMILALCDAQYECGCHACRAAFKENVNELAILDGIRHDSEVYYLRSIRGGRYEPGGFSEALSLGGLRAGQSYLECTSGRAEGKPK